MEKSSHLPSVSRAPITEELQIKKLQKSLIKLRKTIETEAQKLEKFRTDVKQSQRELTQKVESARYQVLASVKKLSEVVLKACQTKGFSYEIKSGLRDILVQACDEFEVTDLDLPEWLFLDPPVPSSLKKVKPEEDPELELDQEDKEANNQDPFEDFFDEFSNEEHEAFEDFISGASRAQRQKIEREAKLWQGQASEVNQIELRALRKIYLKLASATHPDRATSEQDRKWRNEMLARINTAYQKGQLTILLELETQISTYNGQEERLAKYQFFKDELRDLEQTKILLDQQLKRLKQEHKTLKKSELGKAYQHLLKNPSMTKLMTEEIEEKQELLQSLAQETEAVLNGRSKMATFKRWFRKNFYAPFDYQDDVIFF